MSRTFWMIALQVNCVETKILSCLDVGRVRRLAQVQSNTQTGTVARAKERGKVACLYEGVGMGQEVEGGDGRW